MSTNLANLLYLITIVSFILALRFLSDPAHARRGNQIGAVGMLVAVVVTWVKIGTTSWWAIAVGMLIGGAFGAVAARRVKMTAMPQMVALFNGVGGGAAALIALAELHRILPEPGAPKVDISLAIVLSALIGAISFSGSLVAFAKLQELIGGRPITYPGQQFVNGAGPRRRGRGSGSRSSAASRTSGCSGRSSPPRSVFGVLFVLPIGGADMPVVISLLNAFTGLAVAASGFELENNVLIVAGMLVGASGTLLTRVDGTRDEPLDRERPLRGVRPGERVRRRRSPRGPTGLGALGERRGRGRDARLRAQGRLRARLRARGRAGAARRARSSPTCSRRKGVEVSYAIHPVAGRMPGHMNVLLAEANVPYPQLKEMDETNPEFARTDVALVIGANDVVNPDARNNEGSPIYGMPILNVDQAQAVVVLKRSMNPGFAGIDNPLFHNPKTVMLFGDAKESIDKLIADVKDALSGPALLGPRRRGGRPAGAGARGRARGVRRATRAASGRCRRRCTCRPTRPATSARCRRSAAATRC